MPRLSRTFREILDRTIGFTLLVIASPVLALAALAVRLTSRGPAFFRQQRVGLNGRPFEIYKLRTMYVATGRDEEARGATTLRDDPRVTPVGRWLRKTKLDELPQLCNLAGGTMALVGPRPTVASDHERMTHCQRRRADVKPGITGLAQVHGNTALSWPQRIQFDLEYVARRSLWLDLSIIARTAWLVLIGRAETNPPGACEWTAARGARIVCVGANLESREALTGLIEAEADIVGLVTLPADRGSQACDYCDLHPLCEAQGIPTIDALDINAPETLAAIAELAPDFIYTLGWSQLFGETLLNLPSQYVVGSHPSLLPVGRGRAPVPWTVLEEARESAVTLFPMAPGAASGPILLQKRFEIPARSSSGDVYATVARELRRGYCELYELHRANAPIDEQRQDAAQATHRGKRTPADGHIDFSRPAAEIERLVRATTRPYPGAYAYYNDYVVRVWQASRADDAAYTGTTGQILRRQSGRLLVQAGDAPIWLDEVTVDGVEHVGTRLQEGARFGYRLEDEVHQLRREVVELQQQLAEATAGWSQPRAA